MASMRRRSTGLGKMGFEEYSIVSMLENESNHEREHAAQIKKTLDNG